MFHMTQFFDERKVSEKNSRQNASLCWKQPIFQIFFSAITSFIRKSRKRHKNYDPDILITCSRFLNPRSSHTAWWILFAGSCINSVCLETGAVNPHSKCCTFLATTHKFDRNNQTLTDSNNRKQLNDSYGQICNSHWRCFKRTNY